MLRLPNPGVCCAIISIVLGVSSVGSSAAGQELTEVYLRNGQKCGFGLVGDSQVGNEAQSSAQAVFSRLLMTRLDALDEKTATDLFGEEFSKKFVAYRLCVTNGMSGATSKSPGRLSVYLIGDFLRIPVKLRWPKGEALSPEEVEDIADRPEFENLGFTKLVEDKAQQQKALCPDANAYYSPPTSEEMLKRKIYLRFKGIELSRTKPVALNDIQRQNVLRHFLKPFENIPSNQMVERILAIPEKERIGGRDLQILPCPSYLRVEVLEKVKY